MMSRTVLALLACAVVGLHPARAAADLTRRVKFEIAPQGLPSALLRFSEQSGVEVTSPSEMVEGKRSRGVAGTFEVRGALELLLADTNLVFEAVDDRTVVITRSQTSAHASQSPKTELEEVVVTGTQIRGAAPVGSSVTVIGRNEIESSGYSTLHDMLMSRPEFSGAGVSEVQSSRTLDTSAANPNRGTALNLRGLGADSTLVLINGRRQPGGGLNGAFVDVSSIPAAAVERVEILADGASALYGSDAVGGVVNFILRRELDGAESSVRGVDYDGGMQELILSQVLGTTWQGGSVLGGYQFNDRESLSSTARPYTRWDLRQFGGGDYRRTQCVPGNILSPTTGQPAFAIPAGQDGTALTVGQLTPGQNLCEIPFEWLPEQTSHDAFVTFSQAAGQRVELFADARFGLRQTRRDTGSTTTTLSVPRTNAFYVNPFGGTGNVSIATHLGSLLGEAYWTGQSKVYAATVGANVRIAGDWEGQLVASYGRNDEENVVSNLQTQSSALSQALADSNPATALNLFGDGSHNNPATIAAIRGEQTDFGRSTDKSATAIFNGSLFNVPAGAVKVALGFDYVELGIDAISRSIGAVDRVVAASRDSTAAFAEARIPIVARALEFSAAARTEDYSDFGRTTNEKYGFTWSVLDTLDLRGTWGSSFKAPRLNQIVAIPGVLSTADRVTTIVDPKSPTGRTQVLARQGNNASLQPETADVWTLGLDYTFARDTALHVSYFSIDYQNRIGRGGPPGNPAGILTAEAEWSGIVIRNPTTEQLAAVCAEGFIVGTCPTASLVGALVDLRYRNLAGVQAKGMDVAASTRFELGRAELRLALAGTYTMRFAQRNGPDSPSIEYAGTYGNPARVRVRTSAQWRSGAWGVSGDINYVSSEDDPLSLLVKEIPSWTTVDLGASYDFDAETGLFSGLGVSARAVNLLNRAPPFADVASIGFDPATANLYGRVVSLQVNKTW